MKKIIIHIEEIKKQGAKVQFQIKLPSTAKKVYGILITTNPYSDNAIPPDGEDNPPNEGGTSEVGWLTLRIPEKRDVFYAEAIRPSSSYENDFHSIKKQGLAQEFEWWFKGTKREFFKVTVPIEDTIIEGFYEDRSTVSTVDYQLKIYLELLINKS